MNDVIPDYEPVPTVRHSGARTTGMWLGWAALAFIPIFPLSRVAGVLFAPVLALMLCTALAAIILSRGDSVCGWVALILAAVPTAVIAITIILELR